MHNLHYLDVQRIVHHSNQIVKDIHLRSYVFSGFPKSADAEAFLSSAIGKDNYQEIASQGLIGVAFIHKFSPGREITCGIDLAIYRSAAATEDPLTINIEDNPMIHIWTFELYKGAKTFQVIDRSSAGALCTIESIILGRESKKLLKALNNARANGKPFFPARYHETIRNWPNIKEFKK